MYTDSWLHTLCSRVRLNLDVFSLQLLSPHKLKAGSYCIARYSIDGCFYRARITRVIKNSANQTHVEACFIAISTCVIASYNVVRCTKLCSASDRSYITVCITEVNYPIVWSNKFLDQRPTPEPLSYHGTIPWSNSWRALCLGFIFRLWKLWSCGPCSCAGTR